MKEVRCPVCGRAAEVGRPGDSIQVKCSRCGPFVLTGTAAGMLPSRLNAEPLASARTSHAIRSRTTGENWLEIDSTMVDQITSEPLPPPAQQRARLIAWMKDQAGDAPFVGIDLSDADAMAALVGATDAKSFGKLLDWASADGLIEITSDLRQAALTPKGWENEAAPPQAGEREMPQNNDTHRTTRGHCPHCGGDRRADIVASHEERWDDEEAPVWAIDTHDILRCRGCEAVYVRHSHIFSEDQDYERNPATGQVEPVLRPKITYWPAPARRERPDWVGRIDDQTLRDLLDELYQALDADNRVLAAFGTRTALDRAMVLAGGDPGAGFEENLAALAEAGRIIAHEREILSVLTDAGSAAAHRSWRPDPDQIATIMEGMESFLHRALILGVAVEKMKNEVPPRPPRQKRKGTRQS